MRNYFDTIIIGAGAAGLMCAITAERRGCRVLLLEKSNKPGKKILMSGGGRCNFTNYDIQPENYLGVNPHFCKSALSRYTQWDFIDLVEKHGIDYHEKTRGQLFCNNKSSDILNLLLNELINPNESIRLNCSISNIKQLNNQNFEVKVNRETLHCQSLVVASGGLSIPTLGASGYGFEIARQFGHKVITLRPGLVPFTWLEEEKKLYQQLAGISLPTNISSNHKSFSDFMLFTHRGLSGPAILQISSYWKPGESVDIDISPAQDIVEFLQNQKLSRPKQSIFTALNQLLPKKTLPTTLC